VTTQLQLTNISYQCYNIIILWDHRFIYCSSLTETSLCGAYLYIAAKHCFIIEMQLRISAYSKLLSDCVQLYKEKNTVYCLYIIVFSLKMARYEPKRVGATGFLLLCV
jgi:hypothetical protein